MASRKGGVAGSEKASRVMKAKVEAKVERIPTQP